MARPTGPTSSGDFTIISDLLESIEQDPSAIEARRLLAQQYERFGWTDEAAQQTRTILSLSPGDEEAAAWLIAHLHEGGDSKISYVDSAGKAKSKSSAAVAKKGTLKELQSGYKELMASSSALTMELQILQELCGEKENFAGQISDLRAIAEGRLTSVVKVRPPPAARAVAGKIKAATTLDAKGDVAFGDLEANARWLRSRSNISPDDLRSSLLKRSSAIKSSLSKDFATVMETTFMHIEHEVLLKKYLNPNNETMLGDPISSIPRMSFFVSEDGYAWDMVELASAIKANGGVMRNPLSRDMFSAEDVRNIVRHPLGKDLGALQMKQAELTRGVRKETVTRLESMAKILLGDMSADSAPSRSAVEDFTIYVATLPTAEQEALDKLKVPATDSHTGNAFDTTVGDAVADAKANRQCFHKTADFLRQAATWLRNNRGVANMPGAWS